MSLRSERANPISMDLSVQNPGVGRSQTPAGDASGAA